MAKVPLWQKIPAWLLVQAIGRLPLFALHKAGSILGCLSWMTRSRKRHRIESNLALVLPELPTQSRTSIAIASIKETFKLQLEVFVVWCSPRRVLGKVVEVRGLSCLVDTLDSQSAVICCAPHLGSLEVMASWLASFSRRRRLAILYRSPKFGARILAYCRSRADAGAIHIPIGTRGILAASKHLKAGGVPWLTPDHVPELNMGATTVDFFGVPKETGTLLPRLAERFNCRVLSVFAQRLPNGKGFRIHIAPITLSSSDTDSDCAALNQAIESCACHCITQYQWNYNMFKKRPRQRAA